jgi:hypothetical protein
MACSSHTLDEGRQKARLRTTPPFVARVTSRRLRNSSLRDGIDDQVGREFNSSRRGLRGRSGHFKSSTGKLAAVDRLRSPDI